MIKIQSKTNLIQLDKWFKSEANNKMINSKINKINIIELEKLLASFFI
jgi:hypothetical protein